MAEAVFDVAAALERMRIGCNHLANQVIGQAGCKVLHSHADLMSLYENIGTVH